MRAERPPLPVPPDAVAESALSPELIAQFRVARDRLRDELRGRDDAAAAAALRAFALAAVRAGFTRLTTRASVQVVVEEAVRASSPGRSRALNVGRWMRRFDVAYDALIG